jgi:hypothetical protein
MREMEQGAGLARSLDAHTRLLITGFKNAMKAYFSYRSQSVMRILGTVMEISVWGVLGTLIMNNPDLVESLAFYQTPDMVTFILSGLIINRLVDMAQIIQPGFFVWGYKIYHNRPFNLWVVAVAHNLDAMFFWRFVEFLVYVAFATLVFRIQINLLSTPFWVVILLGALFRLGLNLFTAGWTVVTKSGQDPVNWFYNTTSRLFTGELIPITVLWGLQGIGPVFHIISLVHPKTYVQTLGRQTAVGGAGLAEILPHLGIPLAAALFFLFLGIVMLRLCIKRAKREGTLSWEM